jgi:hypothetical protein
MAVSSISMRFFPLESMIVELRPSGEDATRDQTRQPVTFHTFQHVIDVSRRPCRATCKRKANCAIKDSNWVSASHFVIGVHPVSPAISSLFVHLCASGESP